MDIEDFKKIQATLPLDAGVYKYLNNDGKVLYVGKAKNLRSRLSSYFAANRNLSTRILLLLKRAARIEYIIVENQYDALLLENQLIKKYKPKYNILLKDDKSYPYICIKNEPFPRVFITRKKMNDGSQYLGPYPSMPRVRIIMEQIKNIFPLRSCSLLLNPKNIQSKKFKLCLEYHIGNCLGPCVALQSIEHYEENIQHLKNMLKANFTPVIKYLKEKMLQHANDLAFENAEIIKKKIDLLIDFQSKSQIVNPNINEADAFTLIQEDDCYFINHVKVMNGTVIYSKNMCIEQKIDENKEDILSHAIIEMIENHEEECHEIIIPFPIDLKLKNTTITVAKAGDKKGLLSIAYKNALHFKTQYLLRINDKKHQTSTQRILTQMQEDLKLNRLPFHIECFDNSNIQGNNPVAAVVVFKNTKPSKKDYRHFNIKTVVGPNDFASMEEIIFRRYKRLQEENGAFPDLILIDGGKGQLHAACNALEKLNLHQKINIISIAKRLEEIYFPNDPLPLYINKKSESLKILQQLRNEAHRFAINFHRQKRSSHALQSAIEKIPGIGKQTLLKLLNHFKSEDKIKKASLKELQGCIDEKKAKIIFNFYAASM